jgi:hypothetical protein
MTFTTAIAGCLVPPQGPASVGDSDDPATSDRQRELARYAEECGANRRYNSEDPARYKAAQCLAQKQIDAMNERVAAKQAAADKQQREEEWQRNERVRKERRDARKDEPCTDANAREDLLDRAEDLKGEGGERRYLDEPPRLTHVGSAYYHVNEPSADDIKQRTAECVAKRTAKCQENLDALDTAEALVCWTEVHDRVDEPTLNTPADLQACFDKIAAATDEAAACLSMPEKTDEQIVAKADCLASKSKFPTTCGHLDAGRYADQLRAAKHLDAEETGLQARAAAPRERLQKAAAAEAERQARIAAAEAQRLAKKAADEKAERDRCIGTSIWNVVIMLGIGQDIEPASVRGCQYEVPFAIVETTTSDGWTIVSTGSEESHAAAALRSRKLHPDGSMVRGGTATFIGVKMFNRVDGGTATIATFSWSESSTPAAPGQRSVPAPSTPVKGSRDSSRAVDLAGAKALLATGTGQAAYVENTKGDKIYRLVRCRERMCDVIAFSDELGQIGRGDPPFRGKLSGRALSAEMRKAMSGVSSMLVVHDSWSFSQDATTADIKEVTQVPDPAEGGMKTLKVAMTVKLIDCSANHVCAGLASPTAPSAPSAQPAAFNGNEYGWVAETGGHPFFRRFAKDVNDHFTVPPNSDASGLPVGCFHMSADGRIVETKLKDSSSSPDLDRAAQDAITAVEELRNRDPKPVPTDLLVQINRWMCFRFNPYAQAHAGEME